MYKCSIIQQKGFLDFILILISQKEGNTITNNFRRLNPNEHLKEQGDYITLKMMINVNTTSNFTHTHTQHESMGESKLSSCSPF